MSKEQTILGSTELHLAKKPIKGEYTRLYDEDFFVIKNYNQMRPFFMTIVSSSDHWLFISSNGALSAGRRNPENALFPYYSDDKITDSVGLTGGKTIFRIKSKNGYHLWEPFTEAYQGLYNTSNNIYKNREGNKLIFEEINHDLGVSYRYGWMFSDIYGIIKDSLLINETDNNLEIEVLDGIQNLLPFGVDSSLQNARSTLVDAYKRGELDEENGLGIFSLSSMIVDKAEPSEALKATTVWATGIEYKNILLSSLQVKLFRTGRALQTETEIKAEKGAFFIEASLNIKAKSEESWLIASEVSQNSLEIAVLRNTLTKRSSLYEFVKADIMQNKENLRKKIGLTDGIQLSNDRLSTGRHFSNVLFNIMRGGTFDDQYLIETVDFAAHIETMNKSAHKRLKAVLHALPETISYHQLRHFLLAAKHKNIMRYYLEYLPLSFSRRHGDPSRPWNYFSIETKDEDGNKLRNFEGNWRDIFQNWEALAYSYPEFTLGMIAKFVNASTIDGYNPYRISRKGIDWEVIEPNDPWSHIGYWGDHQVIYLTKFLEISIEYHPDRLKGMLTNKIFTYANVPYRIKGYDAIMSDPKDTIHFDHTLAEHIDKKVEEIGSDGKLVWNKEGHLERVNLTEKLLVMILTKLYNFIPEGGIWLNTQRPEWNDANNALVGHGVSMVTLYYLRRLLALTNKLYYELESTEIEINKPVIDLMLALERGFLQHKTALSSRFTDESRRQIMDDFGIAGEHYRTTAYAGFTGDKRRIKTKKMLNFFDLAKSYLEHTIDLNKRKDGLYHSYNLISLNESTASISYLYEMLEGQVAVLSAKYLKGNEAKQVMDALKSSSMFRPDQYSYMLYPDRELDPFLKKNNIDPQLLKGSKLVDVLLSNKDSSIIVKDINGNLHFNGNFHNEKDLKAALAKLSTSELRTLVRKDTQQLLDAFETVFDHKEFTGRSGAFYGYEGLGSIYWHMVSKLLLALQENIRLAHYEGCNEIIIGHLVEHYYEVRAGIGVNKSPQLYGAFPTDAYSHTPKYAGAKQPGMTGQVKEDIINRWAELGIEVKGGRIYFNPFILRKEEFILEPATLSFYDSHGEARKIEVPKNGLAFTYCQIPIIYQITNKKGLNIIYSDGSIKNSKDSFLNILDSKDLFKRSGKIESILLYLTEKDILN